jgi:predicted metal-binding membrane protein
MTVVNPWMSAGLLVVAAVYQLTPMKNACLNSCRSPAGVIALHARGAFRLGVEQGTHCVGCCWALMLLLFAGGVMNLWTIASLTVFVLIEKIAPFGARTRTLSAAGLLGAAVWVLLR